MRKRCVENCLPHRRMRLDSWGNGCKFRNHRFDILLFQLNKNKSIRQSAAAYRRLRLQKESLAFGSEKSHELLMVLKIHVEKK